MVQNVQLKLDRFKKVYDLIQSSSLAGKVHPEESYLRVEQALTAGKSQYIFKIKKDEAGVNEKILDRNDVFVPNVWGLFIGLRNNTNGQIEKLFSYVPVNDGTNPSVHTVALTSDSAEAVYNGQLSWAIDNQIMISSFPTAEFKNVPEQQGLFLLDSSDAAKQEGIQSEWQIGAACQTIIPRLTIAGTRDHQITVNFNAAGLTFTASTGYTPYLCLYMGGYLIKGGCEYIDGKNSFGDVVGKW